MNDKQFPIQSERGNPGPTSIPWSVADKAYSQYSARYGKQQTLERLAERCGFCPSEMDEFYPAWRDETSRIIELERKLTEALALIEQYQLDIRNAESTIGLDLMAKGFCQGSYYKNASKRLFGESELF